MLRFFSVASASCTYEARFYRLITPPKNIYICIRSFFLSGGPSYLLPWYQISVILFGNFYLLSVILLANSYLSSAILLANPCLLSAIFIRQQDAGVGPRSDPRGNGAADYFRGKGRHHHHPQQVNFNHLPGGPTVRSLVIMQLLVVNIAFLGGYSAWEQSSWSDSFGSDGTCSLAKSQLVQL